MARSVARSRKNLSRDKTLSFSPRERSMLPQGNALHLDLASSDGETPRLPQVHIAFLCAAITGFAACQNDRQLAERVNFSAPSVLARRLVEAGSRVVFLSSNAVFDWSEPHVPARREPHPVTEYGHFKAKAEKELAPWALPRQSCVFQRFAVRRQALWQLGRRSQERKENKRIYRPRLRAHLTCGHDRGSDCDFRAPS